MGWEHQRYYTRSRKVAGKVEREYFGKGPEARLAATLDSQRRERKRLEREAMQANRDKWIEACEPLNTTALPNRIIACIETTYITTHALVESR